VGSPRPRVRRSVRTGRATAQLEGALLAKVREAMTAPMTLASMVNAQLEVVFQGHDARTAELAGEIDYGL
jgi:hypothetical protein